jgi:hypothetical protein
MSETTTAPPAEGEDRTELKRVMGPKLLLLFIVGDILGRVYASPATSRPMSGAPRGRRS